MSVSQFSQQLTMYFVVILLQAISSVATSADWYGYKQVDFVFEGRKAILVVPKASAAGNPWIWRTEFFGHEPQADLLLLENGFHVAYVDMQNSFGAPVAIKLMNAFYDHLTREFSLNPKVVLEGFSRGGLYTLNWAAENTNKVACIYNDAPVCDFKSWPAAKGKAIGSPGDWERLKMVYGFATDEEALSYRRNPIDHLEPLAKAKIPLLHVCGETDETVPIDENSRIVQRRYQDMGGTITLISKPNCNHHPHSLKDPTRIINFVLQNTGFADRIRVPLTPYGYDYFQLRDGLERSLARFRHEKTGRVAFLGGSITEAPGWRDLVCEELKRRFPETQFDFVNAGISSLGSTPGAFRYQRDVLAHGPIDLLFEEAAVNDDTNGFSDIEQIRGMEGIVRQARSLNPNVDIVLLHFADPGKIDQINRGQTPNVIANHEKIADHYRIPSINLAREVAERIHFGEFTWAKDFIDLHPSPFGHNLYSRSISRLFDAAWKPGLPAILGGKPPSIPEPIDVHSYFHGRLISPREAVESHSLAIESGWKLIENWKPSDAAPTRAGFVNVPVLVADDPSAVVQFRFKGTGIGLFVASGPDAGIVEFRIDGKDWKKQELYTPWSPHLHLPWAKMLDAELTASEHVIELRPEATSNPASKGHAIRIVFFLVNE